MKELVHECGIKNYRRATSSREICKYFGGTFGEGNVSGLEECFERAKSVEDFTMENNFFNQILLITMAIAYAESNVVDMVCGTRDDKPTYKH